MIKLSLIIVTYNSSNHIYDCLDSVFTYNDIGKDLEVIIVDNNSQEQLMMFDGVRAKYGDKVVLINSGKNGGYGYGNNFGIKMSSSPVVIVMNPDVRLVEPLFQQILDIFESQTLGMIGVSFVDGSSPFYYKPGHVTLFKEVFIPLIQKYKKYDPNAMFMSGSFLAFRKQSFLMSGAFDERIFMYMEEADITNRLIKANYHVEWHPELKVLHLAHGRKYNEIKSDILNTSFEYYCKKYEINTKKEYKIRIRVLTIKKIMAWVIRNSDKYKLFSQNITDLKSRLIKFDNRQI